MDKYLRSVGLLREIRLNTTLTRVEVQQRLNGLIEHKRPFRSGTSGPKKLYEGEVNDKAFELRRKKGFLGFDNDSETMVKVLGSFEVTSDGLVVNAQVVAQTRQWMIVWLGAPVFLLMLATLWESSTTSIPQILIITCVFVLIAFFQFMRLRVGISKMRRTAELELLNILKS